MEKQRKLAAEEAERVARNQVRELSIESARRCLAERIIYVVYLLRIILRAEPASWWLSFDFCLLCMVGCAPSRESACVFVSSSLFFLFFFYSQAKSEEAARFYFSALHSAMDHAETLMACAPGEFKEWQRV